MSESKQCINLVSGVSHDLKSPLHAILGFTELVKSELETLNIPAEKMIQHLTLVSNIGNDMLELINNMLTRARLQSGEQSIEPLFVTREVLIGLINELEETFKAEMISRNIDFIVSHGKLPEFVHWDIKSLRYFVMNNLVSNALKFVNKDGIVHVHIEVDEEDIVSVSVADNGPGIPLADREEIFSKFTQASTTIPSKDSCGLGLFNASETVKTHHGSLKVSDGINGKGVTFTMCLPATPFEVDTVLAG